MNKPVAKAKPATKPDVKKTPAAKQAAPAAKKVAATHSPASSEAPAKAAAAVHPAAKKAEAPAPVAAKKATTVAAPVASPAVPVKVAAPAAPAHVSAMPARSGRVSSRLSSLTVPSMPQTVASTAAKSSFTKIMSTVLVPPPPVAIKKDPKLANNWKTKSAEQLTDDEVIAMPESEYMNDKQMAFFRLKLMALKQGILDNAGETTEHLREDTVVVPDPADRATIEEEHALELRTRDRERKLLKKIEQSIQRIDAGDYGYCDETGEPIGVGRLLARPTATLSLEAQQRRELKQKMFGD
ncbi:RNA polymerase-binding protein DksA [Variovorax sp. J22R133]|uniref:RNA polymerase-binding protein DksA n=1 Tax=Variovorax brevis TaxID=3053503 RepID=UPI002577A8D1|nr:RNA polymerase-binding protein DksA [Variovorax sp. J22R133]MDM0114595.1 RNA polymerase-binding protein DksA [Variovorax sp. J22R133]